MGWPVPLVPRPPWEGRRIVLGVTGGIAAYKSVQVARDLTRLGARVDVVPTRASGRFVGSLSFEGVTGRPVLDSLWSAEGTARHIRLAREADLVVVAPATADLLARAAAGRVEGLLTAVLLATRAPVLLAPAMNDRMWANPATRRNAARLEEVHGFRRVGPTEGPLAVGEAEGAGRMAEPAEIVERTGPLLGSEPRWEGRKVLVTSGPTREAVDPVRFVGNRSSGRMGHAIAREAVVRGAEVLLVTGPTHLAAPVGASVVGVESTAQMLEQVSRFVPGADVAVHAAAVADYRPSAPFAAKRRKEQDEGRPLALELVRNPDIVSDTRGIRREGAVCVGFALETEDLVDRARRKLEDKGLDLIVANPAGEAGAGFEVHTNRVTVVDREGKAEEWPLASKEEVARRLLDRIAPLLQEPGARDAAARGARPEGLG